MNNSTCDDELKTDSQPTTENDVSQPTNENEESQPKNEESKPNENPKKRAISSVVEIEDESNKKQKDMYHEFDKKQKECFDKSVDYTVDSIKEAIEAYLAGGQYDNKYEEEHETFYNIGQTPSGWLKYLYTPGSLKPSKKDLYDQSIDAAVYKSNWNQYGRSEHDQRRILFVSTMGHFLDDPIEYENLLTSHILSKLREEKMKKHMLEWFLWFYLDRKEETFDLGTVENYLKNFKEKKKRYESHSPLSLRWIRRRCSMLSTNGTTWGMLRTSLLLNSQ